MWHFSIGKESFTLMAFFITLITFTSLHSNQKAVAQDTTPPELINFSFTPATVDVSSGPQNITLTVHVTDDLSGFNHATIAFSSPTGQMTSGSVYSTDLVSGSKLDGIFQASMGLLQFAEQGTWHVDYVALDDPWDNQSVYGESKLIAMGFSTTLEVVSTQSVAIDIKPEDYPNSINSKSNGKIPIAIFSTKGFNAPKMVDQNSLTFGRTGNENSLAFCNPKGEDINRDGFKDLVCHFYTQGAGFQCGDSEGVLKGMTMDGKAIGGSDSVRINPCKK